MANVTFIQTTSAYLDSLPIVEGRFTFITDEGLLYRDTATAHVLVSGPPILIQVNDNPSMVSHQILTIKTTDSYMSVEVVQNDTILNFSFIQ